MRIGNGFSGGRVPAGDGGDFVSFSLSKLSDIVYACYCHPSWTVGADPCSNGGNFSPCCTLGYGSGCDVIIGRVTIQKPAFLSGQAVQVSVSGSFDDDIAVNGAPVSSCRTAGAVSHSFQLAAGVDSFELGAVDSYGGCGHGELEIQFSV